MKHLCETWRNRVDFRDGYIQAARDLEEAAGIAQMKLNPDDVEAVETFPCIESLLIRSAQTSLLEGRMEEAACLAESRKKSFWSREQPEFLLRWSALELAGRFMKEAAKIRGRSRIWIFRQVRWSGPMPFFRNPG